MKPFFKTRPFQIRWNEALGLKDCPYAYRWVFIFFGFSIRVHKFIKTEPMAHHHDHAWDFVTIVLKGGYTDVSPDGTDELSFGSVRYRKAEHKHSVVMRENSNPSWTLLFCFRPKRKWGFWINNKLKRPLKYFDKIGYLACDDSFSKKSETI